MFVINSECRAGMSALPENSIDAVVTDPPYGLSKEPKIAEVLQHWLNGDDYEHTGSGFMGKSWDSFVPGPKTWEQVLRVLKPGGHALVFAGSRTQDLMCMALRMAGFEIRDQVMWLYGSGFPKSLDVSKAIDKHLGVERRVVGEIPAYGLGDGRSMGGHAGGAMRKLDDGPASAAAALFDGYGTALKPAYEPVIVARKPLDGTVGSNVLKYGTGGINVDGCRTETRDRTDYGLAGATRGESVATGTPSPSADFDSTKGRWPANVVHDGLPEEWARYFYCAKASKADRNAGLEHFDHKSGGECTSRAEGSAGTQSPRAGAGRTNGAKNHHPTVKPTELMRWLCRLVGRPGCVILDPFSGSGSTGRGAVLEGFGFIGFEMDPEYAAIANARILDAVMNNE